MNYINLTPIALSLIALAGAIATRYLVPWLREKLGQERTARLMYCAGIAVHAAEQMFSQRGTGTEKLNYALKYLRDRGFDLSADELRAAVEAAVHEMSSAVDAA